MVDEAALVRRMEDLQRQLRELTPSIADAFRPVVADLQATIEATIADTYYTKVQTDAKVASPGAIAPTTLSATGAVSAGGDVAAGGQVTSAQPLKSPGSYAYQVTTGYKAGWINNDGQVGFSPSTRRVKKDLVKFPEDLAAAFLALTPYLGRYTWDAEDEPLKVFLIAEEAEAAGFGPDVVPVDDDGDPETINYSQLVVPLLAVVKQLEARVVALEENVRDSNG